MKRTLAQFAIIFSSLDKRYIQILILISVIAMLVLGAGAPGGVGPF